MSGWGFAGCPTCREPLMSTLEQPQNEFYCMTCKRYLPFLRPVSLGESAEVESRHAELRARFDAGER